VGSSFDQTFPYGNSHCVPEDSFLRTADESDVLLSGPGVQVLSRESAGHHGRKLIGSAGEDRASEASKRFGVLGLTSWMAGIGECEQDD